MNGDAPFGPWLKARRQALDLTQDSLAQRVSCASITIRKIESGERRPSQLIAERLAYHLVIPPPERPAFVQWARVPSPYDDQEHLPQVGAPAPKATLTPRHSNLPAQPTR